MKDRTPKKCPHDDCPPQGCFNTLGDGAGFVKRATIAHDGVATIHPATPPIIPEARIANALEYAMRYGGIDGDHHKAWVIDQMVRALTGCRLVQRMNRDYQGISYTYQAQIASAEYEKFVSLARDGDDGPETYTWDEGIAP